ncbi:hypothetical protein Tco_0834490 [Tanacetum coccineum]
MLTYRGTSQVWSHHQNSREAELAKKLDDRIPKTVDEMFKRVRAFIRGEVVAGSAEMVHPSQGDKGVQGSWKEVQWHQHEEQISRIREQAILRARSNSERRPGSGLVSLEKTRSKEDIEEVFTISHECSDQYVTMGATFTTNCKQLLVDILQENMEVFAWTESESITVLRQIRMAEDDEEKTGFHTEEGVYCFTHMLKELKNSAATLQRMMENVLTDQRGQNVEIHLEDIVIKRKSEQNLIQDVKETLRKLRRVKIKVDPTMYSFGVKEGKFLGHMVTEEGLRANPERIHAIILSPTPRSPNQIRSLFLKLTAISKFISKLAKLKHPLREARTRTETAKEAGWTNEAEEAL